MHVSSLPGLFACPSSQMETDHQYDVPSDAAGLGRAVHDALAETVMGREPDLKAIAASYGAKESDLTPLHSYGRMAWGEVKGHFSNARVEERLVGDGIRGQADVFHLGDETRAVLDWKTNRERADYRAQLLGYAACAVNQYGMPPSGEIKLFTVWVRLFEIDVLTVTFADLQRFYEDLTRAKRNIGRVYGPGDACLYCRRQLVCPVRREYLVSSAEALAATVAVEVTPEDLPRLYQRAQMLTRAIDRYKKAMHLLVDQHGPQSDGAGNTITLAEVKRTEIKAREAWPILIEQGFTDDDLAGCCNIASGAMYEIVGQQVPKGYKGKHKEALKALLQERGALSTKSHKALKVIKGDKS